MPDKDWRVTMEFVETATNRLEDTTFCIRETAPLGTGNLDAATVAADLVSWLQTKALAMAVSGVKLSQVRVNHGGPFGPGEGDPQESGAATVNVAGTLAAGTGSLPHGVCARCTLYTSLASRRGRGRFHAPSPSQSSFLATADTWTLSSGYGLAVVSFANELASGHDFTHDVISHHYSLRVHSRADATTRDVRSVLVRPEVSYIRSRLTSP